MLQVGNMPQEKRALHALNRMAFGPRPSDLERVNPIGVEHYIREQLDPQSIPVPADLVRQLSYDRADSVRKSILDKYKFDPNKFKVIGNGWDNPVPGMTDSSNPEHNKKNRRVEVKVFPLEKE